MGVIGRAIRRRLRWARRYYPIDVLVRAVRAFSANNGSLYAAAISYYLLFSIFPLLILVVTIFNLFIKNPDIEARLIEWIVTQIPEDVNLRRSIEGVVQGAGSTGVGLLGIAGLFGSLWTASGVFGALRRALNTAFNVSAARPYITARLYDIVSVLGVILLVAFSAGLTFGITLFRAFTDDLISGVVANLVWGLVFFLLPLVISFASFALMYGLIPNMRLRWRDVWVGALLAAIGFEACKAGFTFYVANFGRYQQLYGAIGGVVAFLFFVFLVSSIVIFCAGVIAELAQDHLAKAGPVRPLEQVEDDRESLEHRV